MSFWCNSLFDISLESLNLKPNILKDSYNNPMSIETDLKINPLYYGERHNPQKKFSMENLRPETTAEQVQKKIFKK